MGGLLATLSSKFSERWLSLLVLPGALFVSAAAAAQVLGQGHALDLTRLVIEVGHWTTAVKAGGLPGLIVAMLALLLASAAAGIAAQALGAAYEYAVLASRWESWPTPLRQITRWCVNRRRQRWESERAVYVGAMNAAARRMALAARTEEHEGPGPQTSVGPDVLLDAAYHGMTRISEFKPQRPTWTSDRINAVAVRFNRAYHLDLGVVWPSLWLTLPEGERTEISVAREAMTRANALAGWGILYLTLAVVWWPGLVIGAVTTTTAWRRSRDAAETYAQLIEASTQLHALALARQLGVCSETDKRLTPDFGWTLTLLLQGRGQGPVSRDGQTLTTNLP